MSKSNTFETDLLNHIFNNAAITGVGDASGLPASATEGSLYVSLHTADPGEAGDQTTDETSYTGYSRVAVARNSSGWTVSGNSVSNAAAITFGTCTGNDQTVTHVGIGTDASGAGKLLYYAALTASLSVTASPAVTPEFAAGQLTVTED